MNIFRTTLLVSALSALGIVMVGAPASASEDLKTYAANMCVANTDGVRDFRRYTSSITRIDDNGTGRLYCPIVRDQFEHDWSPGYPPDTHGVDVQVYVRDAHFTERIVCGLAVRSFDGRKLEWTTERSEYKPREIGELTLSADYGARSTYLSLTCVMPTNVHNDKTQIYGYRVMERHE